MDDFLAEQNRREEQLYEELANGPVCDLTGIVSADGVGGGKSRGQKLWSLLLSFDAWRIGAGPIRTDELTLRRRVTEKELRSFQKSIDAETVIKVRARVAEQNIFGSPQAYLEEFVEPGSTDPELNAYLAQLQNPKTYQDERFGTFTLDRRVGWYSADVEWNGESLSLTLNVEEPGDIEAALKVAYALWDDESSWSKRVGDYAVQELLPLKNENWLEDDEADVLPKEFKSRMTLESISVYPDGAFDFWHDDGELFWGHSIQISGNLSEGLTRADIPG